MSRFLKTIEKKGNVRPMKLRALWERYKANHRMRFVAPPPLRAAVTGPKPFQSLTHDQSVAILEDAIQWLIDEAKATLELPNGAPKERRRAELRGRHESMVRDFARLARKQED